MITRLNNDKFAILTEAIKGYKESYSVELANLCALTVISDCGEIPITYHSRVDMLNDIATLELVLKERG